MDAVPQPPRGFVPALDGLRGIAVGLVVLHHVWRTAPFPTGTVLARLPEAGWCGVDLFFALSGFLITGILVDTREQPSFWSRFAIRRALRILPLTWSVLAVVLGSRAVAGMPLTDAGPWWSYPAFLANWWIGQKKDATDLTLDVTWSLAIEEQFYLVWPPLVRFLPRRALVGVLIAAMVAAPVARALLFDRGDLAVAMFTVCRMDAIAAGGLACLAVRAGWRFPGIVVPAVLALALVVSGGVDPHWWPFAVFGYSAFAVAFAWIVAGAATTDPAALGFAPLRAVGRVSFAVYLLHPLALAGVRGWIPDPTHGVGAIAYAALGPALAVAMAALTWRVLEAPALAWKDRLAP
jgi:peptidoglycan/LPS O-acetylase OafA/YrhL